MSEGRSCIGRIVAIGCIGAFVAVLAVAGFALYGLWSAPAETPELTATERETATSKLEGLERSLRTSRPFETELSEAELTLLAQEYLEREGIEGDVSVTLPEDDLQLSFRAPVEQLERFIELDRLPGRVGSELRGTLRVHLGVTDDEPFAELESVSLYGVPVPLGLLGSAAEENWLERLDADSAAAVRRIRTLEIRDKRLFVRIQ